MSRISLSLFFSDFQFLKFRHCGNGGFLYGFAEWRRGGDCRGSCGGEFESKDANFRIPPILTLNKSAAYALYELAYIRVRKPKLYCSIVHLISISACVVIR